MTIEVGDIKAGTGMLAVLFAFDGDAVLLSIHDGMLAADHAAQAAQRVGELLLRRHGRCLLAVALAGHPARQPRHVGLRARVPGLRHLVPRSAGRLGQLAFAVGHGQILAGLARFC